MAKVEGGEKEYDDFNDDEVEGKSRARIKKQQGAKQKRKSKQEGKKMTTMIVIIMMKQMKK